MKKRITTAIATLGLTLAGCQALPHGANLSSSQIDEIKIGASKEQVAQVLGKPDVVNIYHRLNEEVWSYENRTGSREDLLVSFKGSNKVSAVNLVPFVSNFSTD